MILKMKPYMMNLTFLLSTVLTLAGSYSNKLFAAETHAVTNTNSMNVSTAEPSLELLMYLGEWQDNSGQSVNPENFDNGKNSNDQRNKQDEIIVINTHKKMKQVKPDNKSLLPEKEK